MAEYTSFFNPMSRALIAHWALQEAQADFETVLVEWDKKPPALLEANPMGKLPTIIHHRPQGDVVVTESAAICHYLAEESAPDLLPSGAEKAPYFRWLFFASGPLEAAVSNKAMGWLPQDAKQEGTLGYGSFDRAVEALSVWFAGHDFVCGDRFTMADVVVGSQVDWGLRFGTLPDLPSLQAYRSHFADREAYQATLGHLPS